MTHIEEVSAFALKYELRKLYERLDLVSDELDWAKNPIVIQLNLFIDRIERELKRRGIE